MRPRDWIPACAGNTDKPAIRRAARTYPAGEILSTRIPGEGRGPDEAQGKTFIPPRASAYRIATGLITICTVPSMRGGPSTKRNSFTPSFTSSCVLIVSRM
jgi:hypothetical protein